MQTPRVGEALALQHEQQQLNFLQRRCLIKKESAYTLWSAPGAIKRWINYAHHRRDIQSPAEKITNLIRSEPGSFQDRVMIYRQN